VSDSSETYSSLVLDQIRRGVIVCPTTRTRLDFADGGRLANAEGCLYHLAGGQVPILIADYEVIEEYARSSEVMTAEYTPANVERGESWITRIRNRAYPTPESQRAQASITENLANDAVCLSIGGGPSRFHERFLNLNIGPFPNVDIVGDAHQLPYADESVDAIYSSAVFEHLHTPTVAAAEVARVLKRGARAFVCTPFLQPYHGYPDHYQNFTLTGHRNLFERSGLRIIDAGACIGPTFTLRNMIAIYFATYPPFPLDWVLRFLWAGASFVIAPLDLLIGKNSNSHVMASTTYLVAEKV
jgi:SAM-dependent methyltransferase